MSIELLIGLIGSIASIGGAGLAWHQARRASRAADRAERVRRRLFQHDETRGVAELQSCCRRAQNAMVKYGPGARLGSATGVDTKSDASEVQELLLHLGENGSLLENDYKIPVADFCQAIRTLLLEFTTARGGHQLKTGGEILFKINDLAGLLQKVVVQQRIDAASTE